MPHEPGHNEEMLSGTAQRTSGENTTYKVYGTNEPYSGITVEVGGFLYSTVGGALEGDSMQLVSMDGGPIVNPNQMPNVDVTVPNTSTPGNAQNNNPVVRTFRNRFQEPTPGDRIYEYIRTDGSPGAMNLHEHQDGTIMEGHNPNDMGVVVTLNPIFGTINPNPNIPSIGGNGDTGGNGRGGNGGNGARNLTGGMGGY